METTEITPIATVNNQAIVLPAEVADFYNQKLGTLISPKAAADIRGLVKKDVSKEIWASFMAEYATAKRSFQKFAVKATLEAAADDRFRAKKTRFVFNKDGEFVGHDSSFRVPSATELKVEAKAKGDAAAQELAATKAKLAKMEAAMAAAGITL